MNIEIGDLVRDILNDEEGVVLAISEMAGYRPFYTVQPYNSSAIDIVHWAGVGLEIVQKGKLVVPPCPMPNLPLGAEVYHFKLRFALEGTVIARVASTDFTDGAVEVLLDHLGPDGYPMVLKGPACEWVRKSN